MNNARETRSGAFSLVELLVVVGLAAIIVAMSGPRLASLFGAYRLSTAADALVADLQKVRFRAIAEGVGFRVAFDPSAGTYQVQRETSPGTFTNDGAARKIADTGGVELLASATPRFTPRGAVETPAAITLTRDGASRQVLVAAGGRIHVR